MAVPFLSARIRRPFFTISFQFYFSYKNSSGSVTPKSFARWRNSSGVIVWRFVGCIESVFTRISADFSAVCIRPKVRSKSKPAANMPWCAQMARSSSARSWQRRSLCLPEPSTERHRFRTGIQQGTRLPSPRVRG